MDGPEHGRPCEKCRQRRVKCDRRRPGCLRCERLFYNCPGYPNPTERKFLDQGASLRRRYETPYKAAAEITGSPCSREGERHSSHANDGENLRPRSDTIAEHALWQGNSSSREWSVGTTTTINGSREVPIPPTLSDADALQIAEAHTTPLDDMIFDPTFFDIDPQAYYAKDNNSCGFIAEVPLVRSSSTRGNDMDSNSFSDTAVLSNCDHELAHLIRFYTENISPWMDLHDKSGYFTHKLPLEAMESGLLRYCIAAVATRQLGRTGGVDKAECRHRSGPLDQASSTDWYLKAAGYYDKALNFLRLLLESSREDAKASAEQFRSSTNVRKRPLRPPETRMSDVERPTKRRRLTSEQSQSPVADVLLAAVSVLMVYERLESGERDQSQHLDGLESLLQIHLPSPATCSLQPTSCWLASFWLLARADYKEAFVNRSRTRLDTSNIALWQAAGVCLEDNGTLNMYMIDRKADTDDGQGLAVVAISRTMIWILAKILNHIANQNEKASSSEPRSCASVKDGHLRWEYIRQTLDDWHDSLPREMRPYAKARLQQEYPPANTLASSVFDETFISDSTCATTLQLYHFACVLVFQHDPLGSQEAYENAQGHLWLYRKASDEACRHGREICSIAIGQSNPSILPEMVQPLYLAGTCLQVREERITIIQLLRHIHAKTGFPTEYRVTDLLLDWGWWGDHAMRLPDELRASQ